MPNTEQIQSMIRWALSVSGPVGAYLIAKGINAESLTTVVVAIITIVGAIPPILSFIWGWRAHTDAAKIKAVEALPDVKAIVAVANPDPASAVAVAVSDPLQHKVVVQ